MCDTPVPWKICANPCLLFSENLNMISKISKKGKTDFQLVMPDRTFHMCHAACLNITSSVPEVHSGVVFIS